MPEFAFPTIFAAGTVPIFFTEVAALIVAGALIAYISFRLKLVPIVGFLIAGVLIGPNAIGLVKDQALVDATAEIGVILLLFTIGIEFSLEKLAKIKKLIFGGGTMQVGLSIGVTAGILFAFGIEIGAAIFTGMLVALSSTAIVLKLLADKGETNQESGQIGLGLLIFQDLAIVVMVMVVPVLAGSNGGTGDIVIALLTAGAIIAVVLVAARKIMPTILEMVAKTCSPELFLLTVIAICFGTAYLTSLAGVSLSLGAFLAGLMVSESRFSQHALSETLPLQILFSATFFVSVGMLLDLSFLIHNLPIVLAAIVTVLVIKVSTTWISVRALGYTTPVAAASALMLAQIGEFSFVLERVGRESGLFPAGSATAGSQTFIAATVVLMVLTPGLMRIGVGLSGRIVRRRDLAGMTEIDEEANLGHELDVEDHVIVAGYGQGARGLVIVLSGSGIPFVITTLSPDGANEAESAGLPVVRGDATKPFLLRHVGIEKAKMLVIADDTPSTTHRIVSVARQLNPTMQIVVRTRYTSEAEHLYQAGADTVIAEELESVVQLFGEVLRDYKIPATQIESYEELARKDGYAALTDAGKVDLEQFKCSLDPDCLDSRVFKLRDGAAAIGLTAASLRTGLKGGLILKSVVRKGNAVTGMNDDFVFEAGDEVEMSGATEAFAKNGHFFRPRMDESPISIMADTSGRKIDGRTSETGDPTYLDIEKKVVFSQKQGSTNCTHLDQVRPVFPSSSGCQECLRIGDDWVHLRICLTCGHVGCCDSSKNKHASSHFQETGHPIIMSAEPQDDWSWCFEDREYI